MAMEAGPDGPGPLIALAAVVAGMGALLMKLVDRVLNRAPKDGSTESAACVRIQADIESIKATVTTISETLKDHRNTHHDIYAKVELVTNNVSRIEGKMDR